MPTNDIFSYKFTNKISLIEANAGTGKTFSIEVIYLKALVEEELKVSEILLVTFTRGVTYQMKQRIYESLSSSLQYLKGSVKSSPLEPLLLEYKLKPKAKKLLQRALICFDEAAIFSIHGFASLLNKEFFLKSKFALSSELDANMEMKVADDCVHNFWINKVVGEDEYSKCCYNFIDTTEKNEYVKFFKTLAQKLDFIEIVTDKKPAILKSQDLLSKDVFLTLKDLQAKIKSCWNLESLQKFKQETESKKKINTIKNHFLAVSQLIESGQKLVGDQAAKYFYDWFDTKPANVINKTVELFVNYYQVQIEFINCLRVDFIKFANKKLPIYKQLHNFYSYDDIIASFFELSKRGTNNNRFRLVMIDEFQDTDWLQSQSFLNFFYAKNNFNCKIILVGDPKQSIFRFRGGDVFSYLRMKEYAKDTSYRLDKNWRSQKKIVTVINGLFNQKDSFLLEGLAYFESEYVLDSSEGVFLQDKAQPEFKLFDFEYEGKKNIAEIENLVLSNLTAEITKMLDQGLTVGGKNLEPSMICILVPYNKDVVTVRQLLAKADIYATSTIQKNLFQTEEFINFKNLLATIQTRSFKKITQVLLSDLFGYSLNDLQELESNFLKLDAISEDFSKFYNSWEQEGFAVMIGKIIREYKIVENLLKIDYRAVANFYQSLDYFSQYLQNSSGVDADLKYLNQQLQKDLEGGVENLNVESDKNNISIMTIHKSKGLEFPIVFCPYLWRGNKKATARDFFHSKTDKNAGENKFLSYYIGVNNTILEEVKKETKAENRRLLYVLLTRAKHQVCLYHSSSYAKLNFNNKLFPFVELLSQLEQHGKKTEWLGNVDYKILKSEAPKVQLKPAPKKQLKAPKRWNGVLKQIPRSYSFSSLQMKRFNQIKIEKETIESITDLSNLNLTERLALLPAGLKMGNLLHQVLEFWEPEIEQTSLIEFIVNKVKFFDIDTGWVATIFSWCQQIYNYQLKIRNLSIKLGDLKTQHRIKEMGFSLKLDKRMLAQRLNSCFERFSQNKALKIACASLQNIEEQEFQNICNGVIDFVFFIEEKYYFIDWKTNWLGKQVQDYNQQALSDSMEANNYFLQYFIYYFALKQFLITKQQDPKKIGGVFYLFVRGMVTSENFGIYFDELDYFTEN